MQAKAFAPALAARLEVSVPKQATPGAKVIAKIEATNLGKTAWDAAQQIRLGAASGCRRRGRTSGGTSGGLGPGAEPKDSASAGCGCREASGSDDVSGAAKGILFSAFLIAIALRARKGSAANEQR
jgi:hypothetical protein